jgi:hypothetical protein
MPVADERVVPAGQDVNPPMIPGARESRAPRLIDAQFVPGPSLMDAATTADRQREGGGSPLERTRGTASTPGRHPGGMRGIVSVVRRLFT